MVEDASADAEPSAEGRCSTTSDCDAQHFCGFQRVLGCAAIGVCVLVPPSQASCGYAPVCDCDGKTWGSACPQNGYEYIRIAHMGECEDGGVDAAADAQADR
jgi:hypothetical protein